MGSRIGKYKKLTKKEAALSLVDGGTVEGRLNFTGGFFLPSSSPTGTITTLTNADSGKVIFMDASSTNTITLPAISTVSAGWNVKIILTATGAVGLVQSGNSLENKIAGQITAIDADGSTITVTNDADADKITFANGCLAGAVVDIVSNGTLFYINGFGTHATASDKLTLTQAD